MSIDGGIWDLVFNYTLQIRIRKLHQHCIRSWLGMHLIRFATWVMGARIDIALNMKDCQ